MKGHRGHTPCPLGVMVTTVDLALRSVCENSPSATHLCTAAELCLTRVGRCLTDSAHPRCVSFQRPHSSPRGRYSPSLISEGNSGQPTPSLLTVCPHRLPTDDTEGCPKDSATGLGSLHVATGPGCREDQPSRKRLPVGGKAGASKSPVSVDPWTGTSWLAGGAGEAK